MDSRIAVAAMSALAHGGRLSVVRLLVQIGTEGLAAGEIGRRLEIAPNTLSANLTVLSHAGLVVSRRAGRSVIYTAAFSELTALIRYLIEDCCSESTEVCGPLGEIAARATACPAV